MKPLELEGKKFGRLSVVRKVESKNGRSMWLCKCDCGKEVVKTGKLLANGMTRSCGCLSRETTIVKNKSRRKYECSDVHLRAVWKKMIERCELPKNNRYYRYGARGIKVCKAWHDFNEFARWALDSGYKRGLTIERNDIDGDYCPENCRWATYKEQANNRSDNIRITYDSKEKTLKEWSEVFGIPYHTLYSRISSGWEFEKAIKTPVRDHVPYKWRKRYELCGRN